MLELCIGLAVGALIGVVVMRLIRSRDLDAALKALSKAKSEEATAKRLLAKELAEGERRERIITAMAPMHEVGLARTAALAKQNAKAKLARKANRAS